MKNLTPSLIIFMIALAILTGCATGVGGLGSISKTNKLSPGMTTAQVKEVMGDPSQTQFVANKWVWKYILQQPWKGYIPYYLVFDRETQKLQEWVADEAEYEREQQRWLQAFPPVQRQEIKVKGDINVKEDITIERK